MGFHGTVRPTPWSLAMVSLMLGLSCINLPWAVHGASYGEVCDAGNHCEDSFSCIEGRCTCNSSMDYYNSTVDLAKCVPKVILDVAISPTRQEANHWVGLNISWLPRTMTNLTTYQLLLEERVSLGSEEFQAVVEATVPGDNTTMYIIPDLLAYWDYQVIITALSETGNSSQFGPFSVKTLTNHPATIQNLSVQQDHIIAQQIKIQFLCPAEKQRNGTIIGYLIRKALLSSNGSVESQEEFLVNSSSSSSTSTSSSSSLPCSNNSITAGQVGGVLVERNYSFSVLTMNQNYTGNSSEEVRIYIEPRVPILSGRSPDSPPLLSQPYDALPSGTTIDLLICATCLIDSSQGRVLSVGLLVCVHSVNVSCDDRGKMNRSEQTLTDFFLFPTWAEANSSSFNMEYRATPDNWHEILPNETEYSYILGSNSSCDVNDTSSYCNGPLPSDKTITLSIIKCNQAGCDIVTYQGNFTTVDFRQHLPGLNIIGLSVGIAQGSLVILTAIVMGIVLWCRRSKVPPDEEGSVRSRRKSSAAYSRKVSTSTDGRSVQDIEMIEEARDELSDLESPQSDDEDYHRPNSRRASIASVMG